MAISLTTISQKTFAEATAQTLARQADIVAQGVEATLVAKTGQLERYFSIEMPKAREAEYNGADGTKQNNFALINVLARGVKYATTDFVVAWETEYLKIYP